MGIHEQELEISERDEAQFEGSADRLTAISCTQFPE